MNKKSSLVMAKLYLNNKDYKMAEKSFNEYLETNPDDIAALKQLATVYEQTKRFEKAFEMYERCYLAEPDRTGVLLDICRILLMNEVWLQHVDYRKWLNLAIKAFPANPVVVNFKAFLTTLPQDNYSSPQRGVAPSEDLLVKILDKLSLIEDKIEKVDQEIKLLKSSNNKIETVHQEFKPLPPPEDKVEKVDLRLSQPEIKSVKPPEDKVEKVEQEIKLVKPPEENIFKPASFTNVPKNSFQSLSINPSPFKFEGFNLFNQAKDPKAPVVEEKKENQSTFQTMASNPSPFKFEGFNLFSQVKDSKPPVVEEKEENEELVPNEELPIENACDMQPIEVKTGEEDEDVVFEHRCKLYRFRDKEYKERGLGNLRVLKHKTTGEGRLIMRREAIGLVCLNCCSCQKIERMKDTHIRWAGIDASDGEPEMTVFLVKFKNQQLTDTFMKHLLDLFPDKSANSTPFSSPAPKNIFSNNSKPATGSTNSKLNFNNQTPTQSFLGHSQTMFSNNSASSSPFSLSTSKITMTSSAKPEVELVEPKLDQGLVNKARELQLPDLFYHKLPSQEPCGGCVGCEKNE